LDSFSAVIGRAGQVVGLIIGMAQSIEELRVTFSKSAACVRGSVTVFKMDPAEILKLDIVLALFFAMLLGISRAGMFLTWQSLLFFLIMMPFIPACITSRSAELRIGRSRVIATGGIRRNLEFAITEIGGLKRHTSNPEYAATFWLMDLAGKPLLEIEKYAPLHLVVDALMASGVKTEELPLKETGSLQFTKRTGMLLLTLALIWLGLAMGPLRWVAVHAG
jgi:hypothetical protein